VNSLRSPSAGRKAAQVATVAFALDILLQILLALGVLPISLSRRPTEAGAQVPLRRAAVCPSNISGGPTTRQTV
jgi:hypothetical protein